MYVHVRNNSYFHCATCVVLDTCIHEVGEV